jgi:hypothetical protein
MFEATIESLTELLKRAGGPEQTRPQLISEFQNLVWNRSSALESPEWEIFDELAYDLDFYEPNSEWRAENPSFYGGERAVNEIESALGKLASLKKTKAE